MLVYRRNNRDVGFFHKQIDSGPASFNRLPMSIDSLTLLTRIKQRKHLAARQNDNEAIVLGSEIHRLVVSEDNKQNISLTNECQQNTVEQESSSDVHGSPSFGKQDSNSTKTFQTTSINTKSYNTSAYSRQQYLIKVIFV